MKRKARYEGWIDMVGDAAMADNNVVVACQLCGHERYMYAWKLAHANARAAAAERSDAFDAMVRDHDFNWQFNEGAIYIERGT
jgi:hypothetical protein